MSHEATNWAIKQRGLKPAAKVVLWHLCDRYHADHGCFPSLDTLADDCEMSRRSVQDQIAILEGLGFLTVEKMPRKSGRMPRNRYRFSFEADLGQNLPLAKSAIGKNEHPPLANSRNHLGQNLPTNSVIGTSKRTSKSADAVRHLLLGILREETVEAFLELRKVKRAPVTARAAQLICASLKGHPAPDAVVEASIKNGWTGVFPDKVSPPKPSVKINQSQTGLSLPFEIVK